MKLIHKNINGQIFKCESCQAIHIEYKNLNFNFSDKQLRHFLDYLSEIDGDAIEHAAYNDEYRRKIIIPTSEKKSFNILLNKTELLELIDMLKQYFFKQRESSIYKRFVYPSVGKTNLDFLYFLN